MIAIEKITENQFGGVFAMLNTTNGPHEMVFESEAAVFAYVAAFNKLAAQ